MIILSIVSMIILSGCISEPKDDTTQKKGTTLEWCKAGTTITSATPQGEEGYFTVKGMTSYKGKEVCEAEWLYGQGIMTEYFDEEFKYVVIIVRDQNGNIIQEIDMKNPNPEN